MASLTPLSKGLIGLAVIGAMASAVWNFALKDGFGPAEPPSTATTTHPPTAPTPANAVVSTAPSAPSAPSEAPAPVINKGVLGLSPADHAAQGRKLMESGDFAEARGHLEQAVQGGDAGAACHLGEMTLKGQGGIKADQEAAAKLFQLAQSRNTICFAPGQ